MDNIIALQQHLIVLENLIHVITITVALQCWYRLVEDTCYLLWSIYNYPYPHSMWII